MKMFLKIFLPVLAGTFVIVITVRIVELLFPITVSVDPEYPEITIPMISSYFQLITSSFLFSFAIHLLLILPLWERMKMKTTIWGLSGFVFSFLACLLFSCIMGLYLAYEKLYNLNDFFMSTIIWFVFSAGYLFANLSILNVVENKYQ